MCPRVRRHRAANGYSCQPPNSCQFLSLRVLAASRGGRPSQPRTLCLRRLRGGHDFAGMQASMSRKGDCRGNAPTESLWGSLKVGRFHSKRIATRRAAIDKIMDWLTFLQSSTLSLDTGLRQPDAVRTGMAGRPAKASRVKARSREPGK